MKVARNISLTRLYGWAPHDRRATGSVPRNHGKNTTLVAALAPDGLHVPWMIEGAMDTETFVMVHHGATGADAATGADRGAG